MCARDVASSLVCFARDPSSTCRARCARLSRRPSTRAWKPTPETAHIQAMHPPEHLDGSAKLLHLHTLGDTRVLCISNTRRGLLLGDLQALVRARAKECAGGCILRAPENERASCQLTFELRWT